MADISISLNTIQNIKTVHIKGVGVLNVRKLGAGEELDLSFKLRRLNKIVGELNAIDLTKFNSRKPGDLKKITKLSEKIDLLSEEASEIKRAEFDIYKRCLSDDEGGKVVDVIMNTLSDEERAELYRQVFGENKPIESPNVLKADEEDEVKDA